MRRSAARVAIARAALLFAFAALGLRAVQLSMLDSRAADHGDAQTLRTVTLPPERGALLDRSGAALALSIDAPSVYVEPTQLADPAEAARRLGTLFRRDPRQLEKRFRERSAFLFIERWVDEPLAARVQALGLRGVGILHEPRRVYPHKALASRVIGFANIDGRGVRGIEQQEDGWLRGTARRLPMERDGGGRKMLVSGGSSWGTSGGDVALTLDAAMQADAERALQQAMRDTGARGGVVISMDPWSGEIYALAEAPGFDPNHFRSLDYAATRSAAFLDAIEPGSAFKAFLIAAALEQGAVAPDEWIDCGDGTLRVPGKTIRDLHPHPQLDPAGILRVSSNVGAVRVAQELGPGAHFEMLERFGFGTPTGSGFPDESAGVLRDWRDWKPVDHATIAFGQGVSVTPIQLAAATATLANGGEWVRPRLVAARRAAESPWQRTPRESVRRVLRTDTARRVVEMMEGVVTEEGTGTLAALPGIRVAGKTGTAQKWDAQQGTYSEDRFRAWFVGIAPADAPRLVIVAGLDEPRRPQHTGGTAAAPLFARVATAHLARFGILPQDAPAAPALPPTRIARAEPASPPPAPVSAAPPQALRASPTARVADARSDAQPAVRPATASSADGAAPRAAAALASAAANGDASAAAPSPPAETPVAFVAFRDRLLLPDFTGLTRSEVTRITAGGGVHVRFRGTGRAVRQDPPPGTVVPNGDIVSIDLQESRLPETPTRDRAARAGSAIGGPT